MFMQANTAAQQRAMIHSHCGALHIPASVQYSSVLPAHAQNPAHDFETMLANVGRT